VSGVQPVVNNIHLLFSGDWCSYAFGMIATMAILLLYQRFSDLRNWMVQFFAHAMRKSIQELSSSSVTGK
jgi:hypothetical protein